MNRNYVSVVNILSGDMIGCVNTNSEEEFCSIVTKLNMYNCFEDTIYMALIEQLVSVSKQYHDALCYDDIVNVSDGDKDYGWAFAVADVLFPAVLSLCERDKENQIHQSRGLYAFRLMDEIDIQNVADFFAGDCSKIIKKHFSDCDMPSSEDVFRYIVVSSFLIPF